MARCGCAGSGSGGSGIGVADTPTVDMTLLNGIISAATKLDPASGNLLVAGVNGLRVDCSDVLDCVGESSGIAVADSVGIDFTLAGSTVSGDVNAVFAQTAAVTFAHTLGGVGTYQDINEVPDLVIPEDGFYEVTATAVGNATITSAGPGTVVNASVSMALYKNNVIVPNTETRLIENTQGAPVPGETEPALQLHSSGTVSRIVSCAAGDTFQIYGARVSDPGTTSQIISNGNGRSRISAHRIGG